jgi:glycerol-3-phosphate O-acyltransferase
MKHLSHNLIQELHHGEAHSEISRFHHPKGDILSIDEKAKSLLAYYRNNILHILAIPSLIAGFFCHKRQLSKESLVEGVGYFYAFLKKDLFLPWAEPPVAEYLEVFLELGLLRQAAPGDLIEAPDLLDPAYQNLYLIGQIIMNLVQKYPIYGVLIQTQKNPWTKSILEEEANQTLQRLTLLTGQETETSLDPKSFSSWTQFLLDQGALVQEGGLFLEGPSFRQICQSMKTILSPEILKILGDNPE